VEDNDVRGSTPAADGGGLGGRGGFDSDQVEDWSELLVVAFEFEPRKAFRNAGALTSPRARARPWSCRSGRGCIREVLTWSLSFARPPSSSSSSS